MSDARGNKGHLNRNSNEAKVDLKKLKDNIAGLPQGSAKTGLDNEIKHLEDTWNSKDLAGLNNRLDKLWKTYNSVSNGIENNAKTPQEVKQVKTKSEYETAADKATPYLLRNVIATFDKLKKYIEDQKAYDLSVQGDLEGIKRGIENLQEVKKSDLIILHGHCANKLDKGQQTWLKSLTDSLQQKGIIYVDIMRDIEVNKGKKDNERELKLADLQKIPDTCLKNEVSEQVVKLDKEIAILTAEADKKVANPLKKSIYDRMITKLQDLKGIIENPNEITASLNNFSKGLESMTHELETNAKSSKKQFWHKTDTVLGHIDTAMALLQKTVEAARPIMQANADFKRSVDKGETTCAKMLEAWKNEGVKHAPPAKKH